MGMHCLGTYVYNQYEYASLECTAPEGAQRGGPITITTRLQGSNGSPHGSLVAAARAEPGKVNIKVWATNESYQTASLTAMSSGQSVGGYLYLTSCTTYQHQPGNDIDSKMAGAWIGIRLCRYPSYPSFFLSMNVFLLCSSFEFSFYTPQTWTLCQSRRQ